ncbi:Ig-like domain-containing protein [Nocardioides pacificus]
MDATKRLRSGLAAAIAAAVVTTMVPGAMSPANGAPPKPGGDRAWSGYKIRTDGTADGGWIGARKVNGKVAYRIDPGKRAKRTAYRPVWATADLPGKRATRRETARAAYILSRYGSYRYAVQSAAVDVAIDHLLVGGRHALGGRVSKRRVNQAPNSSKIRSFTRTMLRESARHAGAPKVSLSVSDAAVGGTVRATVRVRNAKGRALSDTSVTLTFPGASTQAVRTDHAGSAVATFLTTSAGRHPVRATVTGVPEWRLQVRTPKNKKASRIVHAGVKGRTSATQTAVVSVRPTLQITAPTQSMRRSPVPGSFTLSGGQPGTRATTVRLHGPFTTAAATTCSTKEAATGQLTVTGDGTYKMPALTMTSAGFYTWSVSVAGDEVNEPISGCGGAIALAEQPTVRVKRPDATINTGSLLRAQVTTSGLPAGLAYGDYARVRIYGPFNNPDNIRCTDPQLHRRTTARVEGNGTKWMTPVELNKRGHYALVVTLPAGTFSTSADSPCKANNTIVKVQ